MAKYDPLYEYLKSRTQEYWRPSMIEIEKILGFSLPASAKRYPAWWANQRGAAVQANSWLDAGWETSDVVPGGKVTFKRVNSGVVVAKPASRIKASPMAPTSSEWTKHKEPAPRPIAIERDEEEAREWDVPTDWFWEGHVVDTVERHLRETGWQIISKAHTASKQRGVDLLAERNGIQLLIEAKGYPTKGFRDPSRTNDVKSASPTTQAHHWFAQALLKGVRLQGSFPTATVALAFPDFPSYRKLLAEANSAIRTLNIVIFFVLENGFVEAVGM